MAWCGWARISNYRVLPEPNEPMQPTAANRIGWLLFLALLLVACRPSRTEARLDRLSARVDSLARTVTALVAERGPGRHGPIIARVSVSGVAAAGLASAPVTVVEFTDYQCPFCGRHARETLPLIRREYIDRGLVRYVLKDLPLSIHSQARPAAAFMRCVALKRPGAFWGIHDSLFREQQGLGPAMLSRMAGRAGLSAAEAENCTRDSTIQAALDADGQEATAAGFRGTPAFVLGPTPRSDTLVGVPLTGAYPVEVFQAMLDSLIVQAQGRGPALDSVERTQREGGPYAGTNNCTGSMCRGVTRHADRVWG